MTSRIELNSSSVRPPSGRITSASSRRRDEKTPRPAQHEPCSSTLGKFHDSVNYSLQGESIATKKQSHNQIHHPIIEAKQKFKYMTNKKSYVDETLFGDTTHRQNILLSNSNHHLSHNLMSNMTPLIHNTSLIRPSSATPRINLEKSEQATSTSNNKVVESKNLNKPWKP
jgi:hypothetical protein